MCSVNFCLYSQGKLSESWAAVTKSAVAENILALTKLDETLRQASECIKTPTVSEYLYVL